MSYKSVRRSLSRREFLRGAAVLAGSSLLAACGAQQTPAPQAPAATTEKSSQAAAGGGKQAIKVTLWTHVSQDEQNWFKSEWATSAAKNAPDYDAQLEIVASAHGDLHNKVLANMSAGQELPDIMALTHDFWGRFKKGSIIEDNLTPVDDIIVDGAIGLTAWSKDAKHYGLRQDIASAAFWYRQDLLEEAGITAPIATWDDLMAAGQKLKSSGKFIMPLVIDQLFFNYPVISQLAGAYWTEDGKFNLNTPEALEAITYLKDGLDEGIFFPVSQGDFWGSKFFVEGEVVGAAMPNWYGTFVLFPAIPDQSGKWRVQNLPSWGGRGHKSSSVWGGTAWTFNKNSPNVDIIKQIAKGMFFDTEARIRYTETAKVLPAWQPALADKRIKDLKEPFLDGQQWNQLFLEGLEDSVQAVQSVHDVEIQPIVDEGWTNLMAGKQTPQEYLDSVDQQLKDMGIPLAKG
ncbi:MAG: carbohydrate ABC transporter substrate-binding protein [Chloroflexi bacterium]|nr:carbohydrate ABC transporter substrate-binding protein [Chloroflexota bacterium]